MRLVDWQGRSRVVVTGMGAITPLGLTVAEFWQGLLKGRSGVARLSLIDPTHYPTQIAAEVKGFDPIKYLPTKEARRIARFAQFAIAATTEAVASARLDLEREDRTRIGVLLGNGIGALQFIEDEVKVLQGRGGSRVSPLFFPTVPPNMAAAQVAMRFGLQGYNATIVTACAAGTHGIGEAAEVIRRGAADVMVAGGTEAAISLVGLAGFGNLRALSTRNDDPPRASRPFDAKRDGFVAAEGCGILVLERLEHALDRGAPVLAEVAGYGCTSDAFHVVQPDDRGDGAARAMRLALEDAHLAPTELDYINAHGTSTPLNDAVETLAIKKVFGEHVYNIPISSTKSMIGHALGGAGAMEAIATIQTILTGIIHPTINYEFPDPACDLDYVPNVARRADVRTAMSNSFGFGGQNACVVVRKFEDT